MPYNNNFYTQIKNEISEQFNLADLATLCFDLGIEYDDIAGDTLTRKATELVQYYRKQSQIGELVYKLFEERPNGNWFEHIVELITLNYEKSRIDHLYTVLDIEPDKNQIEDFDKPRFISQLQEKHKEQQEFIVNSINTALNELEKENRNSTDESSSIRKQYIPWLVMILLLSTIFIYRGAINNMLVGSDTSNTQTHFTVLIRVQSKTTGEEIERADVRIEVSGANPFRNSTDSEGMARFSIPIEYLRTSGTLIVDATGHDKEEIGITLNQDQLPLEMNLEPVVTLTSTSTSTSTSTPVSTPLPVNTEEIIDVANPSITPTNTLSPTPSDTPTETPTLPSQKCEIDPPSGWEMYRIQSNDTLSNLAVQTGTDVPRLKEVNCIEGNIISIDQPIWLPFSPTQTDTPTPIVSETPPTDSSTPTTDTSTPTRGIPPSPEP